MPSRPLRLISGLLAVEAGGGAAGAGAPMQDLLPGRAPQPALPGPAVKFDAPAGGGEDESLIDMSRVEGKVKASAVKKVEDIVNNYPGETVSVIRSWMTSETRET